MSNIGDRANAFLVFSKVLDEITVGRTDVPANLVGAQGLYAYTHWNGYIWPERLRAALALPAAKNRYGDDSYLARIIMSSMFSDIHDQAVGGGISTYLEDNEYPITVVDLPNQTVHFAPEGSERDRESWSEGVSFADYVAQTAADYPREVASQ